MPKSNLMWIFFFLKILRNKFLGINICNGWIEKLENQISLIYHYKYYCTYVKIFNAYILNTNTIQRCIKLKRYFNIIQFSKIEWNYYSPTCTYNVNKRVEGTMILLTLLNIGRNWKHLLIFTVMCIIDGMKSFPRFWKKHP